MANIWKHYNNTGPVTYGSLSQTNSHTGSYAIPHNHTLHHIVIHHTTVIPYITQWISVTQQTSMQYTTVTHLTIRLMKKNIEAFSWSEYYTSHHSYTENSTNSSKEKYSTTWDKFYMHTVIKDEGGSVGGSVVIDMTSYSPVWVSVVSMICTRCTETKLYKMDWGDGYTLVLQWCVQIEIGLHMKEFNSILSEQKYKKQPFSNDGFILTMYPPHSSLKGGYANQSGSQYSRVWVKIGYSNKKIIRRILSSQITTYTFHYLLHTIKLAAFSESSLIK